MSRQTRASFASIALVSFLAIPLLSNFSSALAQSAIAVHVSQIARLGCTPDEQSRPIDFPWCVGLHSRAIRSVAFSPDGRFLASGSVDRTIKIWNMATTNPSDRTRQLFRTLPENPEQVLSVVFSSNGRLLASGGGRNVRLWDWQSGTLLQDFQGHTGIVYSVAFSPDNRTLASAGNDKIIRLWNIDTGALISELQEDQEVLALAFSPDGQTLVSSGSGSTVKLWDVEDLDDADVVKVMGPFVHPVWSIAFSPDGERLAFSGDRQGISNEPNDTIRLWDLEGRPKATLQSHQSEIRSLSVSPDGRFVASGSLDNTIKLWDLTAEEEVNLQAEHANEIWSVAFNQNSRTLASGSADNTIKLWQIQ